MEEMPPLVFSEVSWLPALCYILLNYDIFIALGPHPPMPSAIMYLSNFTYCMHLDVAKAKINTAKM